MVRPSDSGIHGLERRLRRRKDAKRVTPMEM